ncbi:dihydrodipicolinate synthase family protein, partial [Microvirga sp. 3-52]|nr:dihydrodipicolinate synthase family protein [Microvirga sp. 3-52]
PELFLKAEEFVAEGKFAEARSIQKVINDIIIELCSLNGSMYSVIKEVYKLRGLNIGSVRGPLEPVHGEDLHKIEVIKNRIDEAIESYL